ncbi:hypothetical protein ACVGWX_00495, partial [Enterobacter hormaechei]
VKEQLRRASALCREVAYITLSSFRVNPLFQDFFSSTDRVVCEVIHIRRVDGGALISLIHISEPTRHSGISRMPSSA